MGRVQVKKNWAEFSEAFDEIVFRNIPWLCCAENENENDQLLAQLRTIPPTTFAAMIAEGINCHPNSNTFAAIHV